MTGEGYDVRFVLLSDAAADYYSGRSDMPVFKDDATGRPAWQAMEEGAVKHDTFVYDREGNRVLFWDASNNSLGNWQADIRAAVEAQGME